MITSASSEQKTVDSGTVAAGSVAAVPDSDDMVEGDRRSTVQGPEIDGRKVAQSRGDDFPDATNLEEGNYSEPNPGAGGSCGIGRAARTTLPP